METGDYRGSLYIGNQETDKSLYYLSNGEKLTERARSPTVYTLFDLKNTAPLQLSS